MLNSYIVASILFSVTLVILGLAILLRNQSSKTNKLFFLFTLFTAAWLVSNYIASSAKTPYDLALETNRAVFFFGGLATFTLYLFIKDFLGQIISTLFDKILLWSNIFIAISNLTPLVVKNVLKQENTYSIIFGLLAYLSFTVLLVNIVFSIRKLVLSSKKAMSQRKLQIDTILASIIFCMVGIVVVEVFFPLALNYYGLTNAGAFFIVFLVVGIAYAVVKHKLFDIRSFVIRSFAYVLAFTLTAFLLITPVVLLATIIFSGSVKLSTGVLLAILTLAVAIVFQPIQNTFNQTTNKLFFRNYYEPQEVLDRLGKLLVGSIDVNHIINGSTHIFSEVLKPQFLHYLLLSDTDYVKDNDDLLGLLTSMHDQLVVNDEIDQVRNAELCDCLRKKGIAVAVRLRTSKTDLGYILLGYKRSGNIYTNTDKKLLIISADEIAISLQNALHLREIQNFNITLQEKVEAATKQLRVANERLKTLDETKDDFISMASHQLRTPLMLVKGYIKMVTIGDVGKVNDKQKKFLVQAQDNAERMVDLVTELLNVSRITSGKFSIEASPVNLSTLVDNEINHLSNLAASSKVALTYNKPKNFPLLLLDEEKTKQVVINFIDNAIHYSRPKGGKVDVQLTAKHDIELRVVDNGIGVPEEEKENLFTKFYRAKNAKDVRPDGTGIGLYLAKVVVTEEGGDLIFESKEGVGSTFGFKFKKDKIVTANSNDK